MRGLSALRIIDFSLGRSEEIFHHGDVSQLSILSLVHPWPKLTVYRGESTRLFHQAGGYPARYS